MRVGLRLLTVGSCRHPTCMVTGRIGIGITTFPALVAVITHPSRGTVLFDTGYGSALASSPDPVARLYRRLLPYRLEPRQACIHQLEALGLDAVHAIVLSHLHPDHIGGLVDFPRVPIFISQSSLAQAKCRGFLDRCRLGLLRDLLPDDMEDRATPIERCGSAPVKGALAVLGEGADLFGDRSVIAVPLPGHAAGQIGLLVCAENGREVLLAADAAWQANSFRNLAEPLRLARPFIFDYAAYLGTLNKLQLLWKSAPELAIVPSHCGETIEALSHEFG